MCLAIRSTSLFHCQTASPPHTAALKNSDLQMARTAAPLELYEAKTESKDRYFCRRPSPAHSFPSYGRFIRDLNRFNFPLHFSLFL